MYTVVLQRSISAYTHAPATCILHEWW